MDTNTLYYGFLALIAGLLGYHMGPTLLEGSGGKRDVVSERRAGALLYLLAGIAWFQLLPASGWAQIAWFAPWVAFLLIESLLLFHRHTTPIIYWIVGVTLIPLIVFTELTWCRLSADGAIQGADWRFAYSSWFVVYRGSAMLVILLREMAQHLPQISQLQLGRFMVIEAEMLLFPWFGMPFLLVAIYKVEQPIAILGAIVATLVVGIVTIVLDRWNKDLLQRIAVVASAPIDES